MRSQIKYLHRRITAIQKDKLLHFIAGLLIAGVVSIVLPWWAALLSAAIAGAVKEVIDYYGHGKPELLDFLYTAAGGFVFCLPEIAQTLI